MNLDTALASFDAIIAAAEAGKAALLAPPVVVVPASGNLQAALDAGGAIEFEGTHTGNFVITVNGTSLKGRPGAAIVGAGLEALVVPPGVSDITLSDFSATAPATQRAVIRFGAADTTQTALTQEPHHITAARVKVPTHRGKRGFEINARNVTLVDCEVRDTWSSDLQDSQAIGINNSSGAIQVMGGVFEAGSENIIVGGDWMKMVGVIPTDLLFDGVTLSRPLSWRTDGVNRVVKNLFELKSGRNVTLRNSTLDGSWAAAQTGYAIVLTPTRDGQVTNVLIENNTIRNAGAGVQILGRAYNYYTASRLGVTFRGNDFTIDNATFGGTGRLAQIEAEPEYVEFIDNTWTLTGNAIATYGWGTVKLEDGTTRPGGPMNRFVMTGNTGGTRNYGLNFLGYTNCGPAQEGFAAATVLTVTGNTLSGSGTLFRTNFPGNTYP